jgi:hypothetical protein
MGVLNSVAVRKESGGVDFQVLGADEQTVSFEEKMMFAGEASVGTHTLSLSLSCPFSLDLVSPLASDRDLLRAQLHEMKTVSHRTTKSNLMTKGTFFSQYLKAERNGTKSNQQLEGFLKLNSHKSLFSTLVDRSTEVRRLI